MGRVMISVARHSAKTLRKDDPAHNPDNTDNCEVREGNTSCVHTIGRIVAVDRFASHRFPFNRFSPIFLYRFSTLKSFYEI